MNIEHCMTHRLLADYFTKPLQGKKFKAYRNLIIGYKHINSLSELGVSTVKECVRICENKKMTGETTNYDRNNNNSVQKEKKKRSYVEVITGKI